MAEHAEGIDVGGRIILTFIREKYMTGSNWLKIAIV